MVENRTTLVILPHDEHLLWARVDDRSGLVEFLAGNGAHEPPAPDPVRLTAINRPAWKFTEAGKRAIKVHFADEQN
jgi:hypothetical protein